MVFFPLKGMQEITLILKIVKKSKRNGTLKKLDSLLMSILQKGLITLLNLIRMTNLCLLKFFCSKCNFNRYCIQIWDIATKLFPKMFTDFQIAKDFFLCEKKNLFNFRWNWPVYKRTFLQLSPCFAWQKNTLMMDLSVKI